MKPKVYIDGKEGTTGLQIYERLGGRDDLELLLVDHEKRRDPEARGAMMNAADIVFFCLPDDAAREAVSLVTNNKTRIIDASTAHRVAPGWVYGLPELKGQREKIKTARFVANPGCHATGFLSAAAPLTALGILPKSYPVTCVSLTGYSGGGKKMIAEYEAEEKGNLLYSPASYSLSLKHKHLAEMQAVAGLETPPVFTPVVDDYYKGMETVLQFHNRLLKPGTTARSVHAALSDYYEGEKLIRVAPFGSEPSRLHANAMAGTDCLLLYVCGNDEHTAVFSLFDNLGKGASGAAVQNMNLMLGLDETTGLAYNRE